MSLWNNMKQTISGGNQQQPVLDETSKAIMDIENKKRTISQASANEQNVITSKINDEYRKIGETSYAMHIAGNFEVDKISDMFETITKLNISLEEKQTKLNEILSRYDEELAILRPAPPEGQAFCKDCGTAYIPGEMMFCAKCGCRFQAEAPEASAPEANSAPVCSNCNAVNLPVAVFCSGCGGKL